MLYTNGQDFRDTQHIDVLDSDTTIILAGSEPPHLAQFPSPCRAGTRFLSMQNFSSLNHQGWSRGCRYIVIQLPCILFESVSALKIESLENLNYRWDNPIKITPLKWAAVRPADLDPGWGIRLKPVGWGRCSPSYDFPKTTQGKKNQFSGEVSGSLTDDCILINCMTLTLYISSEILVILVCDDENLVH